MKTKAVLGRKGLERLDMLLLVVESLDLNGGESMIWTANQLGINENFPNRVELWKLRCHNHLRRSARRGQLESRDSEALILLLCSMAERLYPILHQLLSSSEPSSINEKRWQLLDKRLIDLIKERMNTRRSAIKKLLIPQNTREINMKLVKTLSLCTGKGGIDRLRASLQDSKT